MADKPTPSFGSDAGEIVRSSTVRPQPQRFQQSLDAITDAASSGGSGSTRGTCAASAEDKRPHKNKTVLVAGGAGFIGSHLCERLLDEGHEVICLDRLKAGQADNVRHLMQNARFEYIEADITDPLPDSVASGTRRPCEIYNLTCATSAAHHQVDAEHTLLTNVVGTTHLLRLAEQAGARFLLASTSEVYGDPEAHPQVAGYRGSVDYTGPRAPYNNEGNRAAEALSFDCERRGRAEVRVARIFNTYGPRMRLDDERAIPRLVRQALAEKALVVIGDLIQARSFCYVDDIVNGLLWLMRCDDPLPGPVNLGNPHETTQDEIIKILMAQTDFTGEIVYRPMPVDDSRRRWPDIRKAVDLLGWSPRVSLEEGLTRTVDHFRVHGVPQQRPPRDRDVPGIAA